MNKCPKCGEKTKVMDIVHGPDKTYRRRRCRVCGRIFYTLETPIEMTEKDHFWWHAWYRQKKKKEECTDE